MKDGPPTSRRRLSGKVDLITGILLGLILGLVVAYLLVIVVGGSKDSSNISTASPATPAETTTAPPDRGAPSPP